MNKSTNLIENSKLYCQEKLKDYDFRITPQRLNIFRFLVESDSHPSAEMVYRQVRKEFPNISFDTVNRTLLRLSSKGLIKMVESGHGPRRFDANLKQHYHFRCINCKRIIDFSSEDYDNVKVPKDIRKRFYVLNQKIVLEGICQECLKR
jgi:Fur family peroxide stress response transcriptional regulator